MDAFAFKMRRKIVDAFQYLKKKYAKSYHFYLIENYILILMKHFHLEKQNSANDFTDNINLNNQEKDISPTI